MCARLFIYQGERCSYIAVWSNLPTSLTLQIEVPRGHRRDDDDVLTCSRRHEASDFNPTSVGSSSMNSPVAYHGLTIEAGVKSVSHHRHRRRTISGVDDETGVHSLLHLFTFGAFSPQRRTGPRRSACAIYGTPFMWVLSRPASADPWRRSRENRKRHERAHPTA
ncbi:hypothetical protein EVAR_79188_1 [Eumeta japonica]|uniref:Uncharacterized protein n=1 Tax=Eumeta variegata TaxID=151549 RepID=A0A4C1UTL0_EUMVA|nr:hypothetical protein EVAR_79188_1 [Eumeta japonica]